MTNKELYAEWVKGQEQLPIFMQPWWMDAVCAGKEWDVIIYPAGAQSAKEVKSAMPYLIRKRLGLRYILMPQMTQIGGIYGDIVSAPAAEMAKEIDALKLHYYYQHYPIGSLYPAEMAAHGCKVKKRVTYRLNDLSDLDKVIDNFSRNKKRQLQKALSLHGERGKIGPEEFYAFHTNCLLEHRKTISYSREFLLVLERKTRRLGQSEIVSIHNADGELYAAAYVVWNKEVMHYLIAAQDDRHKDSGAMALLVLECIKLAREKGVIFDFEGSMIRGVASHFKQFGATPSEYYSVEKYYKWWMRPVMWIHHLMTWSKR